jgi:hypothetical protein
MGGCSFLQYVHFYCLIACTMKFLENFRIYILTLQRKSHLCIPFLGIARPKPQSTKQNRQTDGENI